MRSVAALETRRNAIAKEMLSIRSMRRGSVSEQYLDVKHKGKKEPVKRGPYYVWFRYTDKKPVSKRLTSKEEVKQVREDIAARRRFVALCEEFEELTDQLGELERCQPGLDSVKKTQKSPSNRIKK